MIVRLISALERLPRWSRRGLMVVCPGLLLGVLLAGFVLAPTGARSGSDRVVGGDRVLPPALSSSTTAHTTASARSRPIASGSSATRGPSTARGVRDPDALPPTSGQVTMLAVARRFAVAYMPYQIGRLPEWARVAIEQTCTEAFGRYLLAHPAQPAPSLAAHSRDIETYRVASVNVVPGVNTVEVSYVSAQDSADTGAFDLTLVNRQRRWRVAGLET
jgi:hypothetical protein